MVESLCHWCRRRTFHNIALRPEMGFSHVGCTINLKHLCWRFLRVVISGISWLSWSSDSLNVLKRFLIPIISHIRSTSCNSLPMIAYHSVWLTWHCGRQRRLQHKARWPWRSQLDREGHWVLPGHQIRRPIKAFNDTKVNTYKSLYLIKTRRGLGSTRTCSWKFLWDDIVPGSVDTLSFVVSCVLFAP